MDGSSHPLRWVLSIFLGLPLGLLLLTGLCFLTQRAELARTSLRAARYVIVLDIILTIGFAGWGFVYEKSSRARDRLSNSPPGKLVDVGGYRLHLYCTGTGAPTVVLDHGLSNSYAAWHMVQPELAKFTRVCSFDRAGNGWSDRSPKPRLTSVMAEELNLLLLRSGEQPPFVLVGHSAGVLDVIYYARQYRDKAAGLVLVDGAHPQQSFVLPLREKISIRLLQWTAMFGLPRWRGWCEEGDERLRSLRRGFACDPRVLQTEYDERTALADEANQKYELQSLGDLPVIVISRDPASTPESQGSDSQWERMQKDMLRLSSNSTRIIATGSGHAVNLERPDVVVRAIHEVVEQVQNRGGQDDKTSPQKPEDKRRSGA